MNRYVFAVALAMLTSACATKKPAAEVPIRNGGTVAAGISLCSTSYDQLAQSLGKPSRDGVIGRDRIVTWIVEWDPLVRYIGVMLDKQNVVVDLYWNVPTEMPWIPKNRCE